MRKQNHDIDPSDVDDLDEISGDEQYALVWCHTHKNYEWHWIPISEAERRKRKARRNRLFGKGGK